MMIAAVLSPCSPFAEWKTANWVAKPVLTLLSLTLPIGIIACLVGLFTTFTHKASGAFCLYLLVIHFPP